MTICSPQNSRFSMDVIWLKSQNLIGVVSQKGAGHLSIRKLPSDDACKKKYRLPKFSLSLAYVIWEVSVVTTSSRWSVIHRKYGFISISVGVGWKG